MLGLCFPTSISLILFSLMFFSPRMPLLPQFPPFQGLLHFKKLKEFKVWQALRMAAVEGSRLLFLVRIYSPRAFACGNSRQGCGEQDWVHLVHMERGTYASGAAACSCFLLCERTTGAKLQ